jgi:hypothetical protein
MTLRRRIVLSGLVFWGLAARCLELFQYSNFADVIIGSMQQHQQQQGPSIINSSVNNLESSPHTNARRTDTLAEQTKNITESSFTFTSSHPGKGNDVDNTPRRQRQEKPSLIIHVGPHKTGTTTIQTDAAEYFTAALAKDKYVYLGKASERRESRTIDNSIQNTLRSFGCVHRVLVAQGANQMQNSTKIPVCWKTLLKELEHYRQRNISIILSDEDLSHDSLFTRGVYSIPGYFDILSRALIGWNVTIVIGYRRYAEWAMSSLKQLQAGTCFRKQSGWKHEGGEACAEPWEHIPEWMHRQPWPSARVYHSYEQQVAMWKSHGFATKILNFHHSPQQHLSTTLFCNVLTDTPHTCDFARNRSLRTKENALSVADAAYSNIVFAAEERGIFNTTSPDHTRELLTKQLLHHHQQKLGGDGAISSFRHLPLACPLQSELQELLNVSLVVEERFIPAFYNSPGNRDEHTRSFWRMANERKELCKVDTGTLLDGVSSWMSLLAKLEVLQAQ